MEVLFVVNSIIHKPGNIGKRIGRIIDLRKRPDFEVKLIARGGTAYNVDEQVNMGCAAQLARVFNAIRIYLKPNFRSRLYDIKIFEFFALYHIKNFQVESKFKKIAHVLEYSPKIIRRLKSLGYVVILDVPIGPSHYVNRLLSENGTTYGLSITDYMKPFEESSFSEADYIAVPSSFVRDELIRIGVSSSKIIVIQFGVDLYKKIKIKTNKTGIDYCFAGAINSRKGVKFLLEAWDSPDFSNDRLHLLGRITPEISKIIKQKKFNNIILPGFVNTQDYFSKCDVYVFPSLLEGSSKSIYEAMNAGMPVITTNESGSIVENGKDGFIVDKCNSLDIRDKMIFFKNRPDMIQVMGECAVESVSKYSWQRYSDIYFDLYSHISKDDFYVGVDNLAKE